MGRDAPNIFNFNGLVTFLKEQDIFTMLGRGISKLLARMKSYPNLLVPISLDKSSSVKRLVMKEPTVILSNISPAIDGLISSLIIQLKPGAKPGTALQTPM